MQKYRWDRLYATLSCCLLWSGLAHAAGDNLDELELRFRKKIELSIIDRAQAKPAAAPGVAERLDGSESQLGEYARGLSMSAAECFRDATRSVAPEDLALFKTLLLDYKSIFEIKDWGTAATSAIEARYGVKSSDWRCRQDEPATSAQCKPVHSYLAVGLNLYPLLARCLIDNR